MNAPLAAPLFGAVDMAPRDPILGVTEAFVADPNPNKVNLGVGIYCDDTGKVPLLACVSRAERALTEKGAPHPYLPIDGIQAYDKAVRALLLGPDSAPIREGRAITVQAIGGTGALKVGADFLKKFAAGAPVWISDQSWENHRALFEGAGFEVGSYPYYDARTRGLDFEGMIGALEKNVLHAILVRVRGGCETGRPRANDHEIELLTGHDGSALHRRKCVRRVGVDVGSRDYNGISGSEDITFFSGQLIERRQTILGTGSHEGRRTPSRVAPVTFICEAML